MIKNGLIIFLMLSVIFLGWLEVASVQDKNMVIYELGNRLDALKNYFQTDGDALKSRHTNENLNPSRHQTHQPESNRAGMKAQSRIPDQEGGTQSTGIGKTGKTVVEKKRVVNQSAFGAPVNKIQQNVSQQHYQKKQLTDKDVQAILKILQETQQLLQKSPLEFKPIKTNPSPTTGSDTEVSLVKKKIIKWANRIGINPDLAVAVAYVESRFDDRAVSPKGACGIMQVMPSTAEMYGVRRHDLFNPDICIQVGLSYLKDMYSLFNREDLALAAYNCGPDKVMKAGYRIPDISETRDYVRRVQNAARRYSANE